MAPLISAYKDAPPTITLSAECVGQHAVLPTMRTMRPTSVCSAVLIALLPTTLRYACHHVLTLLHTRLLIIAQTNVSPFVLLFLIIMNRIMFASLLALPAHMQIQHLESGNAQLYARLGSLATHFL